MEEVALDVLQKSCYKRFRKTNRKTPAPEHLFGKCKLGEETLQLKMHEEGG